MSNKTTSLFPRELVREALVQSFVKLAPRTMLRNPVMFTVEIGTAIMLLVTLYVAFSGDTAQGGIGYNLTVLLILFITLLFANFAEAIAEVRGKAQAASLRKLREDTPAKLKLADGSLKSIRSSELRQGDVFFCEAGDTIPTDGEIVQGLASIDESAITGESAPVIREAGGDRSSVTGGTRVLSDRISVKVTGEPGTSFLDRMIALVEGASRQKTPNEIALTILLAGFTLVFLIVCVTLKPFADYSNTAITIASFISLFVCLIPTTIGGLLSAIGIAGMDRALQANVITKSGRAVETAGDVDVLLLDKTGTITIGNRKATAFHPAPGVDRSNFIKACALGSLADETPEGKSIVELAGAEVTRSLSMEGAELIKFTAETRTSGVDFGTGLRIRKGAQDAIRKLAEKAGNSFPKEVEAEVKRIAALGGTPLVVAENEQVIGAIELQDIIKPGISERFERLRKMGVKTVMVTGDNPLTAKFIAEKAGVDDFIAEATPEDKMAYIKKEQQTGRLVAMMGDGTNDAPALAQADVGVAMNSGTQAAKEAGNMVDLDNDPTKLIEVVEIGKQLLMTRGTLTTFSIANDVAKYFAIVPALFMVSMPALGALNIMHLHSTESAILSAVIFNAIIIPLLIPLALRGVTYRPIGASAILRRNLLIYGLGGVIVPFIGIKLIDLAIAPFF
ncbi:MAG TPA: potassium-transporting ATPase subunit KdpB [Flavobacteriales bacterium]|nr:potassium-transporting ATPase subunit KdpB [Flavobacteriales bacterium]